VGEFPLDPVEELEAVQVAGEEPGLEDVEGQEFQLRDQLIAVGDKVAVSHLVTSFHEQRVGDSS
jgi:hypothetical protein